MIFIVFYVGNAQFVHFQTIVWMLMGSYKRFVVIYVHDINYAQ